MVTICCLTAAAVLILILLLIMTSQIVLYDPLVWLSGSTEWFDLEDKIHFCGLSVTVARQDGAILKLLKQARLESLQSNIVSYLTCSDEIKHISKVAFITAEPTEGF